MPEPIRLISFDTCPYVERSRIVLEEKGLDYDITFIDLRDKPDWFLAISPRGKVPVLLVDERPIFESMVINEFLDEQYPEPALFPADAVQRAQQRGWIVYANDVLMGLVTGVLFGAEQDIEQKIGPLREAIERVDAQLGETANPYFFGRDFGLVDAVYAPIFSRREAFLKVGGAPAYEGFEHWNAYGDALLERESVRRAQAADLTNKTLEGIRKRRDQG